MAKDHPPNETQHNTWNNNVGNETEMKLVQINVCFDWRGKIINAEYGLLMRG